MKTVTQFVGKILDLAHGNSLIGTIMRRLSRLVGTNIIKKDWDVMIVIDAASGDIIRELQTEFEYITDVDTIWSRGSKSSEWAQNTFIEDDVDLSDIDYVNGNTLTAFVTSGIHERRIFKSEETESYGMTGEYTESGVDIFNSHRPVLDSHNQEGTNAITREAIDTIDGSENRTLIHYMQPHSPFLETDDPYSNWPFYNDHSPINTQKEAYDRTMAAYKQNHRYILSKLRELLSNIDDDLDVKITADHGNINGRLLGVRYMLQHPEYVWFNRAVRQVPYVTVDQSAVQPTAEPKEYEIGKTTTEEVQDRLENLGYM